MNLALLDEAHYLPDTLDANVMSVNNLMPPPTKIKHTKAPRPKQEDTGVSCLAYSNHGNYLAVGCHDGRCLIFDFVTRSPARTLHAHTSAISSVCWGRGSRTLLTAGVDCHLMLWDLVPESGDEKAAEPGSDSALRTRAMASMVWTEPLWDVKLPSALYSACISTYARLPPDWRTCGNGAVALVCMYSDDSPLLCTSNGVCVRLLPRAGMQPSPPVSPSLSPSLQPPPSPQLAPPSSAPRPKNGIWCAATLDVTGEHAIVGTCHGVLHVMTLAYSCGATGNGAVEGDSNAPEARASSTAVRPRMRQIRCSQRVKGGAPVQLLRVSPNNALLAVQSADATLRVFSLEMLAHTGTRADRGNGALDYGHSDGGDAANAVQLTLLHSFRDQVEHVPWRCCCWSPDAEHLIGGTLQDGSHSLHLWTASTGRLARCLRGPNEAMSGVEWHPLRPFVAVSTNHGNVYVWWTGTDVHESWSAFAPNFKELEANEEYLEKEDEFDIVDSDDDGHGDSVCTSGGLDSSDKKKSGEKLGALDASEPDVDITSVDAIPALGAGADEGDIVLLSVPEVFLTRRGHGADADAEEVATHYDAYGYGVQEKRQRVN